MKRTGQIVTPAWIGRVLHVYRWSMAVLAIVLMTTIVIVMGVQVFFRYVLNDSLIWAEEICSYMLVAMSFVLLGIAFERGEMVALRLIMDQVPRRLSAVVSIITYAAVLACLVYLARYGYKFALLNQNSTIPAIDFIATSLSGTEQNLFISRYWLYLLIPFGFCLLALHLAVAILRHILDLFGFELTGSGLTDPTAQVEDR